MNKKILIATLLISGYVPYSLADEVYKCVSEGSITYQSKPCPSTDGTESTNDTTIFDGWVFDSTINQIKNAARDRQLAMTPGYSIIGSTYNEKILNSKPESREYKYNTKIMDKLTTVILFFTKTTQELYKIEATFHVTQLKPEERKYFYESLHSLLSKKYSEAKNTDAEVNKDSIQNPLHGFLTQGITNTLMGTLLEWGSNTDNVVTLNYKKNYQTMPSYKLTYKNIPLLKQNDIETTNTIRQQTNQAITNDANKL